MLWASSAGKIGRTNLSDTKGCTCHGSSPSTGVQVLIEGPDTITAGLTASYQVRISGGPAVAAGTNIATTAGTLNPVDGNLQSMSGELTHTAPLNFPVGGDAVFQFELTAPAETGSLTLAANGNSVNLNGSNSGDQWNFASDRTITVVSPNALPDALQRVPELFTLEQNYPNPFNPQTTISYTVNSRAAANARVRLQIFNNLGQHVVTLVDGVRSIGTHSVRFDGANLPGGTYFYTLEAGTQRQTQKMVLIK